MFLLCISGFNKASALDFPSTILTTTPLYTWCCSGFTKCKRSCVVEKMSPINPAESKYVWRMSQMCQIFCHFLILESRFFFSTLDLAKFDPSNPSPTVGTHFNPFSFTCAYELVVHKIRETLNLLTCADRSTLT